MKPLGQKPGQRIRGLYDCVALVFQGGGALGAYQAGVYQALDEAGIAPDWVAGISIGAINAAIIAGNRPEDRVSRLRAFWERVTTPTFGFLDQSMDATAFGRSTFMRGLAAQIGANQAMMFGQPGFFTPRLPPPWAQPSGAIEATSFYDTDPLRATLAELVDFDRVNARLCRLSVGAVNVRTGNFVFFDNATRRIGPEHVMASGALPPGFPAIKIEGELYWDGGLVSNTPLNYVIETEPNLLSLVFQVDLWSSRGNAPSELSDVIERQKDITYSSRTRLNTDVIAQLQSMRGHIRGLLDKLPEAQRNLPEARVLDAMARRGSMNIVHLIYRKKTHETHSKDYNFSRAAMEAHWAAGYDQTIRTLRHEDWLDPPGPDTAIVTHDIHRHGED